MFRAFLGWEDKLSRIFRVSFASNNRGIVALKGGEVVIGGGWFDKVSQSLLFGRRPQVL